MAWVPLESIGLTLTYTARGYWQGPKDAAIFIRSVHSQVVGFDLGQGLNVFEPGGIVGYSEDFKKVKTRPRAKRCRLWMDTGHL